MRLKRSLLHLLLFISVSVSGHAQNAAGTYHTFTVRNFDTAQLHKWQSQRSFQYDKTLLPKQTIWDKLVQWLSDLWDSVMQTEAGAWSFWIVLTVLSISLIVIIVSRYKGKTSGIWSKSDLSKAQVSDWEQEDIHSIDFEKQIQQSLSQNNFRLAIRLRYLQLLKILDEKGYIIWQPGKTNHDYLQEIHQGYPSEGYSIFRKINRAFEFAWYGDHDTSREDYDNLIALSEKLQKDSFTSQTVANERI